MRSPIQTDFVPLEASNVGGDFIDFKSLAALFEVVGALIDGFEAASRRHACKSTVENQGTSNDNSKLITVATWHELKSASGTRTPPDLHSAASRKWQPTCISPHWTDVDGRAKLKVYLGMKGVQSQTV